MQAGRVTLRSLALQVLSSLLETVLGGWAWGTGSRTHLDTAVVSIPICTGGQPLQWACEPLTVLPGWTLAVHNLEGLGIIRPMGLGDLWEGRSLSCDERLRQDAARPELQRGLGTHHCLVLAGLALGSRLPGSTLLLSDLCTGQELTELLHAAEEAQRHPSPLPGAEGRGERTV